MATPIPYEKLVNAGSSIVGTETLFYCDDADITAVRTLVANNQNALQSAREALRTKCCVPLKYELSFFTAHCADFEGLRNLARAFALELRLARSEQNYIRAANIGVDMLELANAARRGGLVADFLTSAGISDTAHDGLRRLRGHLDELQREVLIETLDRIEREQEAFSDIAERDRQWEIAVDYHEEPCDFTKLVPAVLAECGVSEDGRMALLQYVQATADLPAMDWHPLHVFIDQRTVALLRMLSVDLALRSYHDARSTYPEALSSLIPDAISCLPLDPFTDQPFLYQRLADDTFALYATGPSKIDHGGVFGPWLMVAAGNVDLCLDAYDYVWDGCSSEAKRR